MWMSIWGGETEHDGWDTICLQRTERIGFMEKNYIAYAEKKDAKPREEEMTVTLTMDDGSEIECVILTIFEAGERDYIALLPMDSADAEEGEVYLYRYSEPEGGEPVLDNIEDDDEYDMVADAFDEILDEQEYDELIGEDELEDI